MILLERSVQSSSYGTAALAQFGYDLGWDTLSWGTESIYLHRRGPLLEKGRDRPENQVFFGLFLPGSPCLRWGWMEPEFPFKYVLLLSGWWWWWWWWWWSWRWWIFLSFLLCGAKRFLQTVFAKKSYLST